MRAWVGLAVLAACGRYGFQPPLGDGGASGMTVLRVSVSAAPSLVLADLDARVAFDTLDPHALFGMPVAGGAPVLPLAQDFVLPDATGTATVTLTAHDQRGRQLTATGMADIVADTGGSVAIEIGADLTAACLDGVKDNGEVDVDCGGACPACGLGSTCLVAGDCDSDSCGFGHCEPATGTPTWLPIADMPLQRIGLGAALGSDHLIYVFGGSLDDASVAYTEVDAYDPARDLWGAAPPLPVGRERVAGASDATGTVYAIGGKSSTEVDAFTPGDTQWRTLATLPTARGFLAATSDSNGTVYAYGGLNCSDNDALVTTWASKMALPVARSNLAAARTSAGELLAIAGKIPAITGTVLSFDPTTNVWTTIASLQHARSDLTAATGPDGRVYAIGGFDNTAGVTFVEAARAGAGWVDVATLSTERDSPAATIGPDGRIYVFGGRAATTLGQASAEAYGPVVMLGSELGAAGSTFALVGHNFAASAEVRVYFDAMPVAFAATDANGSLATFNVTVPSLPAGSHVVRVVDHRSGYPALHAFLIQ